MFGVLELTPTLSVTVGTVQVTVVLMVPFAISTVTGDEVQTVNVGGVMSVSNTKVFGGWL
jgi:hypothetical protein